MGYVQGDAAVRHADGAFSFCGRSDEVMNVGGNRISPAEIENAILLDRSRDSSPLLNCAVIGMKDAVLGKIFFLLARLAANPPSRAGPRASLSERLPVARSYYRAT